VQAYFSQNNNDWRSAPEIIAGAGVKRGNLSNLLYKAQKNAFESKSHPQMSRMKLWRLKHPQ
jgi:hypothetical protein